MRAKAHPVETCECENCINKRRFEMNCACGKVYCPCNSTAVGGSGCHCFDTTTTAIPNDDLRYYQVEPAPVPIMYGWQCPVCFNVYAPHVDFCFKCNQ